MKIPSVEIILATYNGEVYLDLFLDSLLKQKFQNFKILVRDDGSTDQTLKIINKFKQFLNIEIINDNKKNIGFYGNFAEILNYSKADYLFLADQDDIWDQNKLSEYLEIFEKSGCLAIFSPFQLIDEQGHLLKREMLQGFTPADSHRVYFWGNNATGCTMALRRTLLYDVRLNSKAHYHDWKIALTAARRNGLHFFRHPLTLYRVHQSQSSGFNNRTKSIFDIQQKLLNFRRGGVEQVENLRSIINEPDYLANREEIKRSLELHKLMSSNKFEARMLPLTLKILYRRDYVSFKSLVYKNIINFCKLWCHE